jgi:hypothetical protein
LPPTSFRIKQILPESPQISCKFSVTALHFFVLVI